MAVFCPACGVRNEGGVSCFVCGKTLPGSSPAVVSRVAPEKSSRNESVRKRPEKTIDPGPVGDRALAILFDRALLTAIAVFGVALFVQNGAIVFRRTGAIEASLISLGVFVSVFLYHTLLEGFAGTTPGKLVMGLRVVNTGDRRMIVAVALRNLLRLVDGLAFYLPAFLVSAHNKNHRRIGDYVGGTAVIQVPIQPLERGAALAILILIIAAAFWGAGAFCPECYPSTTQQLMTALNSLTAAP